jgi:hypothetical protein
MQLRVDATREIEATMSEGASPLCRRYGGTATCGSPGSKADHCSQGLTFRHDARQGTAFGLPFVLGGAGTNPVPAMS